MTTETLYPIRDVARLTGINPVTLRAWQRRYGLVEPQRTEKGHRLYSEQDIEQIRQILAWLELGVSIGQVRQLLEAPGDATPQTGDHWQPLLDKLDEALFALSQRKLETQLAELTANYPLPLLRRQVLTPWLARLTLHLNRADGQALHDFAVYWLEAFFSRRLIEQDKGKPLVLASWGRLPPLELLLDAIEATQSGFTVTMLPTLTPREAKLLAPRFAGPLLVRVGAGLATSDLGHEWPEGAVLLGELTKLYGDGKLAAPVQPSFSDWMREAQDAAGLV